MTAAPWRASDWFDDQLAVSARGCDSQVQAALELAVALAPLGPALGQDSRRVLTALATLGAVDLTTARVVEPQVDASAILHQAGVDPHAGAASTWGVYAASGPGHQLVAEPEGESWVLTGSKPWCSLADRVSHALITASQDGRQRLFAVALDQPGVRPENTGWQPAGLAGVTTLTLHLDGVAAQPVGEPGWYLNRPGFAWGAIGVAAVWFGAAAALFSPLVEAATRREPDQVALMHLGSADALLTAAWATLDDAATRMDDGRATGEQGALLAARVRAVVAHAAERMMTLVGHALGPAPLAYDGEHIRRVNDLTLYLRQHHAERDLAALGRLHLQSLHLEALHLAAP